MTWILFFLCVFQGVAEFLPISSNAHLFVFEKILTIPKNPVLHVALHLGSLLSLIIYFYKDLSAMAFSSLRWIFGKRLRNNEKIDKHYLLILFFATIPAVLVGLAVSKTNFYARSDILLIIGLSSIFFGFLLNIADKFSYNPHSSDEGRGMNFWQGVLVGCAQALAFIPGASRSGICITMGRFVGLNRIAATKFAFLLAIPTITGAVVLTFYDSVKTGYIFDYWMLAKITLTVMVIGIFTMNFIFNFLQKNGFGIFGNYRIAFGVVILMYYFFT